jgi:hypothetical protein
MLVLYMKRHQRSFKLSMLCTISLATHYRGDMSGLDSAHYGLDLECTMGGLILEANKYGCSLSTSPAERQSGTMRSSTFSSCTNDQLIRTRATVRGLDNILFQLNFVSFPPVFKF